MEKLEGSTNQGSQPLTGCCTQDFLEFVLEEQALCVTSTILVKHVGREWLFLGRDERIAAVYHGC